MNPAAPTPSPADDRPPTALARRVGPPIAAVALLAMVGLLGWLALAPSAVAGPVEEAPFALDALLLVPPDEDGCLLVVEGDGTTLEHCLEDLKRGQDGQEYVEAFFDDRGRLVVGQFPDDLVELDPRSGEVTGPADVDADRPPEPLPGPVAVQVDGDRVLRLADPTDGTGDGDVLLDLQAPPGHDLRDAVVSPDGRWVAALTAGGDVVVAPADGSAPPYVWAELPDDRWVELYRGIRWDG